MSQVRGHWFGVLRRALDELGIRSATERTLAALPRDLVSSAASLAWYDEAHVVAVYQTVADLRDLGTVRTLGRVAAREAMQTVWRPLMAPIVRMYVGRPAPAFAQLPVLWDVVRRDGGVARCVMQEARAARTEIRGCAHVGNAAWREAWLGQHEALLRELRVGGRSTVDQLDERSKMMQVLTTWSFALTGAPTEGSLART